MSGRPPDANAVLGDFNAAARRHGIPAALDGVVSRLLDTAGHDVGTWLSAARALIGAGHANAAADLLVHAQRHFPGNIDVAYWRANALRMAARYDDAEPAFHTVLQVQPTHRDAALSLAVMLRDQGRLRAAADAVIASVRARGNNRDETISALAFLRECDQQPLAHELAQRACRTWPQDAAVAALAGEFALAIGDFTAARDALHATLDHDPRHSASWLRLAQCQRFSNAGDADLARIERAWSAPALDDTTRTCVGFALGKALDDLEDYERASDVLHQANALANSILPWSASAWHDFVTQRLRSSALPRTTHRIDFAPVFVVGLPRTGTTLAVTLLARSARVRDRGELNWIDGMYRHLVAQDRLRDPAALASAAQLVAAQIRRDDAPAPFYVDKNPLNFRYLDVIAALFPEAKIIHCRRSRRDTALSLWSQHFAHADLGFAYDFSTIAAFVRGYEHLMAHWRDTRILPIYDLDYEALATDTDATMQGLANFLGMPAPVRDETASTVRSITTASVWQARQAVHSRSIGRWRRYAHYLPELERLFPNAPGIA